MASPMLERGPLRARSPASREGGRGGGGGRRFPRLGVKQLRLTYAWPRRVTTVRVKRVKRVTGLAADQINAKPWPCHLGRIYRRRPSRTSREAEGEREIPFLVCYQLGEILISARGRFRARRFSTKKAAFGSSRR